MTNSDKINYANCGLILASCIVAFLVPFELFLFSYAVLGPLHYLTEIGWLHKKKYFTKRKTDYILLILLCVGWLLLTVLHSPFRVDLIAFSLAISMAFALTGSWIYRSVIGIFAVLGILHLNHVSEYIIWFGIFVPTILHVFIFTMMFMLYGALKEKSISGFVSVAVLILCAAIFFLVDGRTYNIGGAVLKSYSPFQILNFNLANKLGLGPLQKVSDIFSTRAGFVVMRFIAFAYTYHYLNWFSKTSVIKWHKVANSTLLTIGIIWGVSIGLYLYDYTLGLNCLAFLSLLHVFLEFPLNIISFRGIAQEINKFTRA